MSRREKLIDALSIIKDECCKHSDCCYCPFYDKNGNSSNCRIRISIPSDWHIPDQDGEKIEPIYF